MNSPSIPLLDLVAPHAEMRDDLLDVMRRALDSAAFIGGPMVEGFERDFAGFCGVSHAIGVSSGTDAVRFALMAAGVQLCDTVITVPLTFIATAEAITQAGARLAFVDVDERTGNLCPERLREYLENECELDRISGQLIHRRTHSPVTAIVPVHLYGQTADMDPILELAARYKLSVIEDACQAHGAEYYSAREKTWRRAGSMGRAAAFSFYPGKNLGACGEAGAVTTNDEAIARNIRMLRDHGQARKYDHVMEGYNGRLDAIQAGFLQLKLQRLPAWNHRRRELAANYRKLLLGLAVGVKLFEEPAWARSVYHLFVIRVPRRDEVMASLAATGIGTGIHYPLPLHLQRPYAYLRHQIGDFPVAERLASQILSLPMYPQLEEKDQQRVVRALEQAVQVNLRKLQVSAATAAAAAPLLAGRHS